MSIKNRAIDHFDDIMHKKNTLDIFFFTFCITLHALCIYKIIYFFSVDNPPAQRQCTYTPFNNYFDESIHHQSMFFTFCEIRIYMLTLHWMLNTLINQFLRFTPTESGS